MKQFNIRVARDIVTYETVELTDAQYEHFKQWHQDVQGEELDEDDINPNALNDYVLDVDIPTRVNKTYSATEVDWTVNVSANTVIGIVNSIIKTKNK